MPFGLTKNSNRSQQALQESQEQQARASVAVGNQPAGGDLPNKEYPQGSYLPSNNQEIPVRAYQESSSPGPVSRSQSLSQSQRHTAGYPPIPQSTSSIADPSRRGASDDQQADYQQYSTAPAQAPATRQQQQQQQQQPQALPQLPTQSQRQQQAPQEPKKSKASRLLGAFSSSSKATGRSLDQNSSSSDQQINPHNNLSGIGRRISKRHKDTLPTFQGQNELSEKQLPGWQSGQSSESQLPSPREDLEDDGGLDPYLIRQSENQQLEPSQSQIHALQQQGQPTIRLARADTDPSLRGADENDQSPYQQPLQLLTGQLPQPWLAHHNQHQSPASPVGQQQAEYQLPSHPSQYQVHSPNQALPNLQFRSQQNPEVVSQVSHDSPIEEEDQRPQSVQSLTQAPNYAQGAPQSGEFPVRGQSLQAQTSRLSQQASVMAPPPGQPGPNRRSTDAKQSLPGEGRGPPPGYSQQQSFGANPGTGSGNPLPPVPGQVSSGNYRGSALQREYNQGGGDQARNTSPLPTDRDLIDEAGKVLLTKYKKVKTLYFEKQAQVEQLQNTLANQRLSQSRTSLDDGEYATRFSRLDGAIKEFAFSIRKDWNSIPRWLVPFVNQDAMKVGTKEMTAMGRAAISRWIWDEVFTKCFHPCLEAPLSFELKRIEQNLRFSASPATSQEEMESVTSKVIQWKLATVEGLSYQFTSADGADAKARFTQRAVTNLSAHLLQFLSDPAAQGIEGYVTSIIELAVGVTSHLPLESRDICITYPLPGDPVMPFMKLEAPLPPLENPGTDAAQDDSGDQGVDVAEVSTDTSKGEGAKLTKKQDGKAKGALSSLGSQNGKRVPVGSMDTESKIKDGASRVRYAAFMGVEVRGRQYLINPTVWTIS